MHCFHFDIVQGSDPCDKGLFRNNVLANCIKFAFLKTLQMDIFGSDGSMSASGSAGPGFDPRQGSKFSFENFQPRS